MQREHSGVGSFNPLMGTIQADEQMRLKKMIYRVSRGMAHTQFYDLQENLFDYYGHQLHRVVFIVFFPSNFEILRDRLSRVCESFSGEKLPMPKGGVEQVK